MALRSTSANCESALSSTTSCDCLRGGDPSAAMGGSAADVLLLLLLSTVTLLAGLFVGGLSACSAACLLLLREKLGDDWQFEPVALGGVLQ